MTKFSSHILKIKKNSRDFLKAFTLIEMLLAMTIFSFIALGIATSFFSGVKLWSRAKTSDFWRNDVILSFEALSSKLRQSLNIPLIGFEGSPQEISFPALSGNTIVRISYYFDVGKKSLIRKEARLKDILEEKEEISKRSTLSLDEFSVQYLYINPETKKYEWKTSWKKEEGIFIAVKFNGKAHNELFQKTVFIPVS